MPVSEYVECVPNFSEGRDAAVVERIAQSVRSVRTVRLLDRSMDADHNRSVLTFVGPPADTRDAAFRAVETAASLIDLTRHKGAHPRIGATDVVPFVPLGTTPMETCAQLAAELGKQVAGKLQIPVYLYAEAARRPERRELANIRRGEFEALREELGKIPERKPDFGPEKIHPTAGAVAIGARMPLIAFNVYLDTADVKIAKEIARKIRESSGGLRWVKALGLEIPQRGKAQVSMNLTNYRVTSMKQVFDAIRKEAETRGCRVLDSEIIGLLPRDAFRDTKPEEIFLAGFSEKQILETHLDEHDR